LFYDFHEFEQSIDFWLVLTVCTHPRDVKLLSAPRLTIRMDLGMHIASRKADDPYHVSKVL